MEINYLEVSRKKLLACAEDSLPAVCKSLGPRVEFQDASLNLRFFFNEVRMRLHCVLRIYRKSNLGQNRSPYSIPC